MSWTWAIFWIIILISIIIFVIKKWGDNIKTLFKTSRSTHVKHQHGETVNGTPVAGNVNTPHSGHATPTKTKSKVFGKIVSTIFIIALIILLIVFIAWAGPFVKQAWNEIFEPRPKTETVKPPDVITETYPLNKDSKKIRVYTHDGYTYERFSGGWKYYCTPQNGEKTIRGDGNSREDGTVRYFDLEFYEVDCIITVIFTIKKNNI